MGVTPGLGLTQKQAPACPAPIATCTLVGAGRFSVAGAAANPRMATCEPIRYRMGRSS
jgi:hypothetical protein